MTMTASVRVGWPVTVVVGLLVSLQPACGGSHRLVPGLVEKLLAPPAQQPSAPSAPPVPVVATAPAAETKLPPQEEEYYDEKERRLHEKVAQTAAEVEEKEKLVEALRGTAELRGEVSPATVARAQADRELTDLAADIQDLRALLIVQAIPPAALLHTIPDESDQAAKELANPQTQDKPCAELKVLQERQRSLRAAQTQPPIAMPELPKVEKKKGVLHKIKSFGRKVKGLFSGGQPQPA
ncbi:unnamed protein product [Vitrella brassicaformis CCMP3155]|uniref:Uncharacterized protein n=1 Tax=Vitrella brassicaformis (strain CCMP3155) TaxID=1169540 RepID=A0A0G4FCB2_VITBC|nr:unnamed protein product [Vitrella brassicaformis CCMP3155]|eukprot:CEM10838.1 unnamed protein product [Vitrella brassicaformis CCMP3155]